VTERWVCKRCFADNDETNASCHRCGLLRGADASTADQAGWSAAAATATSEPPAWRRWIRFWWVPALAIVLLVGYLTTARRNDQGTLETAGNVSVNDLRAGDCFNSGDETSISDVDGVPCTEPHEFQVFAVATHEEPAFPSDAQMDGIFEEECIGPFEAFVGLAYAESALHGSMITPSEESWADGDRVFVCVLHDPGDATLTSSMEGANR
jgi:hypothetical protein